MERARRLFANRTLNLRAIGAIGYDLDYTLVHYQVEQWEQRAFESIRARLADKGLPVADIPFDSTLATVGLIIDRERGNLVKADRFGYVKSACHGTRMLGWEETRAAYSRTTVDLRLPRWRFLNTLFGTSGGCMYMNLVDRLDSGQITGVLGYLDLESLVESALTDTHLDEALKQEIVADAERYVVADPDTARALLDQKQAGKRLMLITNNEVAYSVAMLRRFVDPYLPAGTTWRDLFDVAFFLARKPLFFSTDMPAFEVVDDTGLMRPHNGPVGAGKLYVGGCAALVEQSFGLQGEDILYVGDHLYSDVNVAKSVLRWRTGAIVRSIEDEVRAIDGFADKQSRLDALMARKAEVEERRAGLRVLRQRGKRSGDDVSALEAEIDGMRKDLDALDQQLAPLADEASRLVHPRWGPTFRAGSDKSHLARQVERYADIYTSRVSNFLDATPYAYVRPGKSSLPHDR